MNPEDRYRVHPFRAGCKIWRFKVIDMVEKKYLGPNHTTEKLAQRYADRLNAQQPKSS